MIQQFKQDGNPLSLPSTLRSMKPKYIVMYDVDVTAIRQIEVLFIFMILWLKSGVTYSLKFAKLIWQTSKNQ
jgi:hypothetical protein